jgi:hypothetical protein
MNALQLVKSHLKPGKVYRRSDLGKWSNAVDRHLNKLQEDKVLLKVAAGMYLYPKETVFGKVPPTDHELVERFLKDSRYLLTTFNAYNALGVGTTQLYNETVVYNHKRHGRFKLGSRYFRFVMKHHFPSKLSQEFLLVDLIDNLPRLMEDREKVLNLVKKKIDTLDSRRLRRAAKIYGGVKSRKYLNSFFSDKEKTNAT